MPHYWYNNYYVKWSSLKMKALVRCNWSSVSVLSSSYPRACSSAQLQPLELKGSSSTIMGGARLLLLFIRTGPVNKVFQPFSQIFLHVYTKLLEKCCGSLCNWIGCSVDFCGGYCGLPCMVCQGRGLLILLFQMWREPYAWQLQHCYARLYI